MSNFYVNTNDGDDADDGTTWALAWATVKHALDGIETTGGDVVYFAGQFTSTTPGAITHCSITTPLFAPLVGETLIASDHVKLIPHT